MTRVRTQGKHSSSGTFRVFRVPPVHPFPTQIQLTNKHLIKNNIHIFSFDKIKGHDEAVAESGHPYRKNDPGGSLSITMDEFRQKLKNQYS